MYKNPSTEVYHCYTFVKVYQYAFAPLLLRWFYTILFKSFLFFQCTIDLRYRYNVNPLADRGQLAVQAAGAAGWRGGEAHPGGHCRRPGPAQGVRHPERGVAAPGAARQRQAHRHPVGRQPAPRRRPGQAQPRPNHIGES